MSNNLLIIGAGQYGHVAKEIAETMGCFDTVSFLDDNSDEAEGKINDMKQLTMDYQYGIVAIGNAELRKYLTERLLENSYKIAILIHPSSMISKSAKLGRGCVIEAGAVINTAVEIGGGVFISPGAVVNHNSQIGEYSHIDCNAVIEAGCVVPNGVKIVSGSVFSKKMINHSP